MSRRTTLALSGAVLAALALAAASQPWTIAAPQAAAFAERDLARRYGLTLSVAGPAVLTLLPVPSLRFSRVRLSRGGHDLVASEGLQVQLGLAGLLAGRAEVTGLVLDRARIALPEGAGGDWAEPAGRLAARVAAGRGRHLRRLVLVDATLALRDPRTGTRETVTGLNLVANWPRPSAGLDLSAGFTWRGVPTTLALSDLRPRELASGAETPVTAALTWNAADGAAGGSAEIDGSLVWTKQEASTQEAPPGEGRPEGRAVQQDPGGPRLSGRGRFATPALPATLAWLGIAPGPAALAGPASLEGRFTARPGSIEWPDIRVRFGDNSLEGAGAATLARGRLAVSGTLAAERLDLSGLVPDPAPGGGWSRAPLALDGLTRGDLDLRLSAASAR
ncbi:AsmA family protein, partial [Methylobacterium platani]